MSSLIFLVSILVLCGSGVNCGTIVTGKPGNIEIATKTNSNLSEKETSWPSILWKRLQSLHRMSMQEKDNNETDKNDIEKIVYKRNSRFLGSLAFLAGLGVGGLANAASSTVKAYANLPQGSIAMNFVPPKVGPYLATYYDPYHFVPNPYVYHTPLGLYPLFDPVKLQSLVGGSSQQNDGERPTQVLTLFDNKRPTGNKDNDEDEEEYIIEQTKLAKKKPTSRFDDGSDQTIDSLLDVNKKIGKEIAKEAVTCRPLSRLQEEEDGEQKDESLTEDTVGYDFEDLQEDADDSRFHSKVKRNSTTVKPTVKPTIKPTTKKPITQPPYTPHPTPTPTTITPITNTPTTNTPTTNIPTTTTSKENITYSPFFGYYGGSPQDISHIDLTSGTQSPIYYDPNPINYNLPYDRPANFYPDEKLNYYSHSYPSSYPSGPFFPEQLTDYSRHDFERLLYSPDNNSPPYVNDFKPVTTRR